MLKLNLVKLIRNWIKLRKIFNFMKSFFPQLRILFYFILIRINDFVIFLEKSIQHFRNNIKFQVILLMKNLSLAFFANIKLHQCLKIFSQKQNLPLLKPVLHHIIIRWLSNLIQKKKICHILLFTFMTLFHNN